MTPERERAKDAYDTVVMFVGAIILMFLVWHAYGWIGGVGLLLWGFSVERVCRHGYRRIDGQRHQAP